MCSSNGDKCNDQQKQLDDLNQLTSSLLDDKRNGLHEQMNELISRNIDLESYSRRENIKFFSIQEEQDKDTEEEISWNKS